MYSTVSASLLAHYVDLPVSRIEDESTELFIYWQYLRQRSFENAHIHPSSSSSPLAVLPPSLCFPSTYDLIPVSITHALCSVESCPLLTLFFYAVKASTFSRPHFRLHSTSPEIVTPNSLLHPTATFTMMSSFSAKRQGRPRPSNISFGRRRSDDKSMPSPSFNSSMALGHAEDVFFDSSRSVDRLRHHYLAMPSTPSSLAGGVSPRTRMERLPSLSDLFHHDILSPPNSALPYASSVSMLRTNSMSSTSSGSVRSWNTYSMGESRPDSIGPPATPLSPYFTTKDEMPVTSPTEASPDHSSYTSSDHTDGERTPRAGYRPTFDIVIRSDSNSSSLRCPGAPLLGAQSRGHFESQSWQQRFAGTSLGPFDALQRRSSYGSRKSVVLSAEEYAKDRAAMARLQAQMPTAPGLTGLGIYTDGDKVQSPLRERMHATEERIDSREASSPRRSVAESDHTGLTPMVKASTMFDTSSTPTRGKAQKTPTSTKTSSPKNRPLVQTKISPSATATKMHHEAYKTPLNKSRPMFRLDNGSGKKSSKPRGHKVSPGESPWGVFGSKDGWKPLAAPNVSRAIAEANKLVSETATLSSTIVPTSPPNKRNANSTSTTSSPSKRLRPAEAHASSSPYKENLNPSLQSMSPSKRAQILSPSYRSSPTSLPLSTVR